MADIQTRYEMANDIIDSKMLLGKDTNQLKQVLGDLDDREKSTTQWYYFMGSTPGGFGVSLHQLVIRFDRDKVVAVDHIKTKD